MGIGSFLRYTSEFTLPATTFAVPRHICHRTSTETISTGMKDAEGWASCCCSMFSGVSCCFIVDINDHPIPSPTVATSGGQASQLEVAKLRWSYSIGCSGNMAVLFQTSVVSHSLCLSESNGHKNIYSTDSVLIRVFHTAAVPHSSVQEHHADTLGGRKGLSNV